MAAAFILQAEVGTRPAPFGAVGRDAAAAGTRVGDEVREFVKKGAFDFCIAELPQARVQFDQSFTGVSESGGAPEVRAPADPQARGDFAAANGMQELSAPLGELEVL